MEKKDYNRVLENKIDLYINGQLDDEEIEQLWSEVIKDSYYYEYMITAANVKKLNLEEKKASVHKLNTSGKSRYYWFAAAAAIAILIGIISVVSQFSPNNNALKPLNQLALQNVRSAEILKNNPQSEIKRGINYANSGKIDEALSLLKKVSDKSSKAKIKASAEMNIGIINYNHKNFNNALQAFDKVVSFSSHNVLMKEKAYWYAGNTYMQLGELKKARNSIQNAYNLNGAYRRVEGKYLKRLNEKLSHK